MCMGHNLGGADEDSTMLVDGSPSHHRADSLLHRQRLSCEHVGMDVRVLRVSVPLLIVVIEEKT